MVFPPGPGQIPGAPPGAAVRVLQLGFSSAVCPRGKYVLYACVAAGESHGGGSRGAAEDDLRGVLELLLDTTPPPPPPPSPPPVAAVVVDADAGGATATAGDEALSITHEASERQPHPPTLAPPSPPTSPPVPQPGVFPGLPRPRLIWGICYRQAVPAGGPAEDTWRNLPPNMVTCPGPDASCDFNGAVAAAAAGHRRLWGAGAREMFADGVAGAAEGGGDGDGAGSGEGGGGDNMGRYPEDEDDLEALLRNIPGQPSTMDAN